MKINPDDPATGFAFGNDQDGNIGLTVRAQIAAMAMQGLLAHFGDRYHAELIAKESIKYTDQLIKDLNKTSNV